MQDGDRVKLAQSYLDRMAVPGMANMRGLFDSYYGDEGCLVCWDTHDGVPTLHHKDDVVPV